MPVELDVTNPESVYAAAEYVGDLGVLINNAGILIGESPLTGDLDGMRRELETNLYGPLNVTRALAPIIAANGGGAILNVHSVLSWLAVGGSYSVSKAALWSATNAMRAELAAQNIQVVGLHLVHGHRHDERSGRTEDLRGRGRATGLRRHRVRRSRSPRRRHLPHRQGGTVG